MPRRIGVNIEHSKTGVAPVNNEYRAIRFTGINEAGEDTSALAAVARLDVIVPPAIPQNFNPIHAVNAWAVPCSISVAI
jgi:hypothetical protein